MNCTFDLSPYVSYLHSNQFVIEGGLNNFPNTEKWKVSGFKPQKKLIPIITIQTDC